MNKSSRQYERGHTTNSYNQDFIYYKPSKELSKSPKFKKHILSYQQHQKQTNHSKIQSMKNTLNTLFDPLSQGCSKSFNKSVAQLPSDNKLKSQILKNSKSVYEQANKNVQLNNKLEMLTSKLRQIAQKPHFGSIDDFKKDKGKKSICKTNEDYYVNNLDLIHKKQQTKNHAKLQEFIAKQTHFILQKEKDLKSISTYSQQLARSKSKSSSSFHKNQLSNSNSQSSSLKRESKNLKNDKSVSTFHYPQQSMIELQYSQRPRGKTVANLMQTSREGDMESTKIKINSFLQKKKPENKRQTQFLASAVEQNIQRSNVSSLLKVLKPHRGPINSLIINSDGKRFLTASNDYTIKESTLDGTYTTLRKHDGRVNIMRMIDDKLYSGGNDCRVKFEKGSFIFQSPVVEIFPQEREYINVGTSSTVELFSVVKKVSSKRIEIKTKWYKMFQKINKEVYLVDNHHLSIIDWRVPYPLINLFQQPNFVNDWVSDPYSLDFYQIREQKMIQINSSHDQLQSYSFEDNIMDYCWKKDKAYFLTNSQLQIFENSSHYLCKKCDYSLNPNYSGPCKLQIKNDLWIYATLDGNLVVNKFQ